MCRRKLVIIQFGCGHKEPIEEGDEDCGSPRCRYSANHIQDEHVCGDTCKQWKFTPVTRDGSPRPGPCPSRRH